MDDYEDRLDEAARKVQRAYRGKIARKRIKLLVRQNYVKIFDKISDCFVYKNKNTGEISHNKPVFLGNDDLPTPKALQAPLEYDPGYDGGEDGYFVMMTNNVYNNAPKLNEISSASNADHVLLEGMISNDFICRIKPENMMLLKNEPQSQLKDSLDSLRRIASKKMFLVIYICTHVVTIIQGEKKNKRETCYFTFPESVWTKPSRIAETCMSLSTFAEYLNRIPCDRKTVIINYAHIKPVRKTVFTSSRQFYPPSDCLSRLADLANCAVLACCTNGISMKDVMSHSPPIKYILKDYDQCDHDVLDMEPSQPTDLRDIVGSLSTLNDYPAYSSHLLTDIAGNENIDSIERKYLERWGMTPDPEIVTSPPPESPKATWVRDEGTGYQLQINLPTDAEKGKYRRRLRLWRLKTTFGAPINFLKRRFRHFKHERLCSPKQVTIVSDRQSVFSRCLIEALRGGSSRPDQLMVSVSEIYGYLTKYMPEELSKLAADSSGNPLVQSPILLVPKKYPSAANNPICFRCGPPAAPERPYIVNIGLTEVTIEWYNPPFDGIPATLYKVYMRNLTRNFDKWREVSKAIPHSKYTVKNLPTGIACQFQVRAYNAGGWGMYSDASQLVIPGEEILPLPSAVRWKRLSKGGPLAVLDRMQLYPFHRLEITNGIKLLCIFGQHQRGYSKSNIAIRVALMSIHALKTFYEDRYILAKAIEAIGWSLIGPGQSKIQGALEQNEFARLCDKLMTRYRSDNNIINSIAWLRNISPISAISQPPPIAIEEPKDEESDSDDDYQEEVPINSELLKLQEKLAHG